MGSLLGVEYVWNTNDTIRLRVILGLTRYHGQKAMQLSAAPITAAHTLLA